MRNYPEEIRASSGRKHALVYRNASAGNAFPIRPRLSSVRRPGAKHSFSCTQPIDPALPPFLTPDRSCQFLQPINHPPLALIKIITRIINDSARKGRAARSTRANGFSREKTRNQGESKRVGGQRLLFRFLLNERVASERARTPLTIIPSCHHPRGCSYYTCDIFPLIDTKRSSRGQHALAIVCCES